MEDALSIFGEEGHRVEMELEAVKRVKFGKEHSWTTLIEGHEGNSVEKAEQE